ncbi:ead/Ea22-like family protein [Enterobacter vonholyi]
MSNVDKRALRKASMHAKTTYDWGCDADNFHEKATPDTVLALLDELEAKEKRIAEQVEIIANQEKWIKAVEETMITATDRAEAAEKRITELESREKSLRTVGVMSQKAFQRLEGRESRFIALWPRPEIYLPRKRPEDGVIVYARVVGTGKGE